MNEVHMAPGHKRRRTRLHPALRGTIQGLFALLRGPYAATNNNESVRLTNWSLALVPALLQLKLGSLFANALGQSSQLVGDTRFQLFHSDFAVRCLNLIATVGA